MSEQYEFNYGIQSGYSAFTTTPALIASVEAHLALWQAANAQPRVYFERIDARTWKVNYGDDVDFYPLATWALNAIEMEAQS